MSDPIIEVVKDGLQNIEQKFEAKFAAVNAALIEIGQNGTAPPSGHGVTSIKSAITKAIGGEEFKTFRAGKAITTGPMPIEIKALTSLQGNESSEAGGVDVQPVTLGLETQRFKPVRVFETLPQRVVTSGNTIGFNKISFVGGTNSADYQEAEGDEKAEQDLASQWIEAPIATIAVHTTLSKQVLDDEAQLARAVENLLKYGLAEKVDRELLNGVGGTRKIEGLVTQASPFVFTAGLPAADRIGQAAAYLAGIGYAPGVVYLHPLDWFAIASERTPGGEYVVAGWNTPASPTMYRLQAIATASIAQGTALVIDPSIADVGMRQRVEVTMSREHNGNLTKNLVTILAELRLGLLVADANGMVTVDLEDESSS